MPQGFEAMIRKYIHLPMPYKLTIVFILNLNHIFMKTNTVLNLFLSGILVSGIALTGCNRNTLSPNDEATVMMQRSADAESDFDEVDEMGDQAIEEGELSNFRTSGTQITGNVDNIESILSQCATVTRDTTTSPKTVVIDFGTTNCLCNDNKNRRGKVLISYTQRFMTHGAVITTTFDNYYVNDNKIEGTKTVTNITTSNGNPKWNIVAEGVVTLANGNGQITWESDRIREWTTGYATRRNWLDDVFTVYGTANGTHTNGAAYSAVVDAATPLLRKVACHQFVSGILTITPSGKPQRVIDFGNGMCDGVATVTVDGKSRTIQLRR